MTMIDIIEKFDLEYNQKKTYNDGFTDKWSNDKNNGHSYVQNFYEKEFKKFKNKNISLLEIGIFTGGSLKLWKEYFKNPKTIIGVDITSEYLSDKYSDIEGIEYFFENAYDVEFIKNLPNFDIIIDDGPHTLHSQIEAINLYLPKLNKGGVFVIEDIQDDSWFNSLIEESKKVSENDLSDVNYEVECLDFRETLGREDDMMFVIKKI